MSNTYKDNNPKIILFQLLGPNITPGSFIKYKQKTLSLPESIPLNSRVYPTEVQGT